MRDWVIYVAGVFEGTSPNDSQLDPNALREDLRFAEIVASTVGNLRKIKLLERGQSALRQFLSPVVVEAISAQDPKKVLTPREADVAGAFLRLARVFAKSRKNRRRRFSNFCVA